METMTTKKRLTKAERIEMSKNYKPKTARAAYALSHPHMVEVVDPEWRARLRSYQN